jgi:hypothetical protein
VTNSPVHVGLEPDVILISTDAIREFTVMVIAFEVAVAGLAQGELEVITQVTTSPFNSVLLL